MEYKAIPGFEDKFEVGEDGTVRNIKTKRETTPYRVSKTLGPLVHIFDRKTNRDARIAVLKVTNDLFGKMPEGWKEIDVSKIDHDNSVVTKPALTAEEKAKKLLEKAAEKDAAEKVKAEKKAVRDAKKAEKANAEGKTKEEKERARNEKRLVKVLEGMKLLEEKKAELEKALGVAV